MKRISKFIANRENKPKRRMRGLMVSDTAHLASEIAKIVEASFYKHNMPSDKRYYFTLIALPKILQDFYPQDYREHRNAGMIRNRLLTGRVSELENVKKAALTTFIGKLVAPDVMSKADFRLYGKHKIEMVLKRIEIGTFERKSSNFRDGHVTMPISKPKIDEEDMSNREIIKRINAIEGDVKKLGVEQKNGFLSLKAQIDGVSKQIVNVEQNLKGEFNSLKGEFNSFKGEFSSFKGDVNNKFDILFKHLGI